MTPETSDGRPLTREGLDAATPQHPVYISHRGGHTAYVNALGYKRANVSEDTPDPPGGRFDRDPKTGKLNGRISERASEIFDKAIGANYSRADYREGVKLICKMMSRAGITSAQDPSNKRIVDSRAMLETETWITSRAFAHNAWRPLDIRSVIQASEAKN